MSQLHKEKRRVKRPATCACLFILEYFKPAHVLVNVIIIRFRMLWTIFVILLILWIFGLLTSYTFGGLIHILLVVAIIILVIRLLQGRSPV